MPRPTCDKMCLSTTPQGENILEESMRNQFKQRAAWAVAVVCGSGIVMAQPPAPAPLAVSNPNYVSIPLEITVNRPAADVWETRWQVL